MLNFLKIHNIIADKIAVGVSGGADSLALVLRLSEELKDNNIKIIALTIDHQLRKESRDEAEYVAQLMQRYDIEHHILTWDGDKPVTGIEEAARIARYDLLQKWCKGNGVNVLAIAHHAKDQMETFFLRLQRGSGLYGLCGMSAVVERDGLLIIRPLLNENPEDIKSYLRERQVKWVEDPSNQSDDFLRVRIRKKIPALMKDWELSYGRVCSAMCELQRTRDFVNGQVNRFINNHVRDWDGCGVSFALSVLEKQHDEIIFQVLAELVRRVGNNVYIPRAEEVERLAKCLVEKFVPVKNYRKSESE